MMLTVSHARRHRVRAASTRPDRRQGTGPCVRCHVLCGHRDFCYGCDAFVCEACSPAETAPEGKHGVGDHG